MKVFQTNVVSADKLHGETCQVLEVLKFGTVAHTRLRFTAQETVNSYAAERFVDNFYQDIATGSNCNRKVEKA